MAQRRRLDNGKPELNDGYLKIANELLQAFIDYDLTAAQMKLVAVIIRETYGYNRKAKALSVSYLAKAIRRDERNTRRALNALIKKNVVKEYGEPTPRRSREIGINKYYLEWMREGRKATSERAEMTEVNIARSEGAGMTGLEGSNLPSKPIQIKDTLKDNSPSGGIIDWDAYFAD